MLRECECPSVAVPDAASDQSSPLPKGTEIPEAWSSVHSASFSAQDLSCL